MLSKLKVPSEPILIDSCFLANLVLVALSFDRVLALWTPVFYFQRSKPSHALITTIILQIFSMVCTVPTLTFFKVQYKVCGIFNFDLLSEEMMYIFVDIQAVGLMLLLPLLCIVTFNAMVVYKVRHRMQSTMSKKDRDITVSLIFVSAAFFVNMTITCVSLLLVFNNRSIDLSTRNLLNWVKVTKLYLTEHSADLN